MRRRKRSGGSSALEFTLAGIPIMLAFISIAQMSLTMWTYQTLAYSVKEVGRYIAVHGTHCSSGTNSCTLTVGNAATAAEAFSTGLSNSNLELILSSPNSTTTCNPVSTCTSNSTQFPPSTDSAVGTLIGVRMYYQVSPLFTMMWPGAKGSQNSNYTLQAFSRQRVLF